MKKNNWKKVCSCILAVCLIGTLLLSNQISGVFAEKEEEQIATQQEQTTEESTKESEETKTSETTERIEEDLSKDAIENTEENSKTDIGTKNTIADSVEESDKTEETGTSDVSLQKAKEDSVDSETQEDDISVQSANVTWTYTKADIKVSGNGVDPEGITVKTGEKENLYTQGKNVICDYSITPIQTVDEEFAMQITDCGIMSDDQSIEVYHITDNSKIEQIQNIQVSEGSISFVATQFGEYIVVSNVATVDLAQGEVTVKPTSLIGKRQDGKAITVNFSQSEGKKYRIAQSSNTKRVNYGITFSTDTDYTTYRTILLDGINTTKSASIRADQNTVLVKLLLRNTNQIHHIFYGTGIHEKTAEGGTNNDNSRLIIDDYDETGELYIPYKMNSRSEEIQYVLTTTGSDAVGSYWSIAGIGAEGNCNNCTGLTIAGGKIRVLAQNANGATAIGGGGNGDAQVSITGGDITAICSSTGAAIGGGIGWINRGGNAKVNISGGKVYAENMGYYTRSGISYGGVAIGSGSSMLMYGSAADINISGGTVTAYARYGNGIGSGNSYKGTAANATINISGNSIVTTNALGGGTSKENRGGSADITIKDDSTVNCVKYSNIQDKWDDSTENILGAFGIGGGNSAGDAQGGSAVVNVSGGSLNCNGGNIGGGNSESGMGGDAAIKVSGGILDCASIGGGNSISGKPGSVTSTTQEAGVVISGGNLKAGTIGGGTNQNGDIGFATAIISGGNIQGQFILANTDTSKQCKFTMTGGTINNDKLDTENYKKAQKNGGAVYLSDPNGEVNISGGTIKNSRAELGGAIYMTAGTFSFSGTGAIFDCEAQKGGAVYILDGSAMIQGGTMGAVIDNKEHPNIAINGGGAYLASGSLTISGGQISQNTAQNGAGAYLQDGNLIINGTGAILSNKATANGGGAYLAGGNLQMNGGSVSGNTAKNGAGSYLSGGELNISGGNTEGNIAAADGGGVYLAGGQLSISDGKMISNIAQNGAGAYVADSTVRIFGGSFEKNKASENGGGIYVSSEKQPADVVIRSGKLIGNTAGTSDTTSNQGNGGAIAVVSANAANADHVIIGLRKDHKIKDYSTRAFDEFEYDDDKDNNTKHTHAFCPQIMDNTASGNGGGIYMNSSKSTLDIYCLLEKSNEAVKDDAGASIMSEGGNVNIGDVGDNGEGNNTKDAVGNVFIKSPMLVKGGAVKIYGNTENPQFADKILVDIQKNAGSFYDYRYTKATGEENYKIEYFENFNGSGIFTAIQYDKTQDITAMGNMYVHKGYKIVGWNTKADKSGTMYTIGKLIGSKADHSAWDGKTETEALRLYAIWEKTSYTVVYNPNVESYSGTMANQKFEYGTQQKLAPNVYKVTGKRFIKWNTKADGQGTEYSVDYDVSEMTEIDGATVTLYAQWADCTHKGGDHPGILSYTKNDTAHTITEMCDCGGYTTSVSISGADVYYDGAIHTASLNYTGTLLAGNPQIVYTYKQDAADSYGSMPEGTTQPKEVGYYKASITVGGKTVSVEYQIKSPAAAATIDVKAKYGQHFKNFSGENNCTVAQDDVFTIQYNVQKLNEGTNDEAKKAYKTAPVLTLNKVLPSGTTIIMQTGNSYWYNNQPSGTEIALSSFTQMGTSSEKFAYNTTNIQDTQEYRFIVDFSNVKANAYFNGTLQIGLKYAYTTLDAGSQESGSNNDKEEKAFITIGNAPTFTVTVNGNVCKVTAPANVIDTRWERKNLVWKIKTKDETILPSDAKLTVLTTVNNESKISTYSLNPEGEFIIPFTWTKGQSFTFTLNSQQESVSNKSYTMIAALCIGSQKDGTAQPEAIEDYLQKASADVTLTIPVYTAPALKISGTDRILSSSEKLQVNIDYRNVEGYVIRAIIQKKADGKYQGKYYDGMITKTGEQEFTLQSTDGAGSYRLWITVATTEGQTLLEVPYYFIVK